MRRSHSFEELRIALRDGRQADRASFAKDEPCNTEGLLCSIAESEDDRRLEQTEGKNMWHAVAWLVTGCLLALWSLGAWALHAVAQWGAGFAGAQAAGAAGGLAGVANQVGELKPPEWLAVWLPPGAQEQWGAMVSTFTPWVEYALTHAPSLVAWLAPAIWIVWALGGVLLLVLGGGLSALILVTKRRRLSPAMA